MDILNLQIIGINSCIPINNIAEITYQHSDTLYIYTYNNKRPILQANNIDRNRWEKLEKYLDDIYCKKIHKNKNLRFIKTKDKFIKYDMSEWSIRDANLEYVKKYMFLDFLIANKEKLVIELYEQGFNYDFTQKYTSYYVLFKKLHRVNFINDKEIEYHINNDGLCIFYTNIEIFNQHIKPILQLFPYIYNEYFMPSLKQNTLEITTKNSAFEKLTCEYMNQIIYVDDIIPIPITLITGEQYDPHTFSIKLIDESKSISPSKKKVMSRFK